MKFRLRYLLFILLGFLMVAFISAFVAKRSICRTPIDLISDLVLLHKTQIAVKGTQSADYVPLNSGEKLSLYFQTTLLDGLFFDLRKIPPTVPMSKGPFVLTLSTQSPQAATAIKQQLLAGNYAAVGTPYSDQLAMLDATWYLHTSYPLIGADFSQITTAKQAVQQEAWLDVSHSIALTSRIWICTAHNRPCGFSGSAMQRLQYYSNQIAPSGEKTAPPLPAHIGAMNGQEMVQSSPVDTPTAQQEAALVNACHSKVAYRSGFSFIN